MDKQAEVHPYNRQRSTIYMTFCKTQNYRGGAVSQEPRAVARGRRQHRGRHCACQGPPGVPETGRKRD